MTAAWLVTLLAAGGPARLVVALDGPDLRTRAGARSVEQLVARLEAAVEVRRLSFAVVLHVGNRERALARLGRAPGVRWVEEDRVLTVALRAVPDDPLYPEQWTLHPGGGADPATAIGVEPAWDETRGLDADGLPVRVAVVDDGFDAAHPELSPNLAPTGRDFSQSPADDDVSPGAGDYHGTQTAGVLAAAGFNGAGLTGVCPACEILPVRLVGGGGPVGLFEVTSSAAAEAIEWAVDNGAAVINNSWGPPDGNRFVPLHAMETYPLPLALAEVLLRAATQGRGGLGTVVVWSAGNGAEPVDYDGFASDPRVIAVGSVDATGRLAYYSDYGLGVDLVAPSSGDRGMPAVLSTDLSGAIGLSAGDYVDSFGGTSASAAMVSGVAALVIARYPQLTAAQVTEALYRGAFAIDASRGQYAGGRSRLFGHGRVDAAGAVAAAAAYEGLGPCTLGLEVCANGLDDDCNGVMDDPEQCTLCTPDYPLERCDGRDNNCDGQVDEYFVCDAAGRPVCAPCTNSQQCALGSLCRASPDFPGTWCFAECASATDCLPGFACDGEVCALVSGEEARDCLDYWRCGQPERCDGLDNDCDGVVDNLEPDSLEAAVAAEQCGTAGVCAKRPPVCAGGRWRCARPELWQEEETRCDGLDNDCDGAVDEHPICEARARRLAGEEGGCRAVPAGLWVLPFAVAVLFGRRLRRTRGPHSRRDCSATRPARGAPTFPRLGGVPSAGGRSWIVARPARRAGGRLSSAPDRIGSAGGITASPAGRPPSRHAGARSARC